MAPAHEGGSGLGDAGSRVDTLVEIWMNRAGALLEKSRVGVSDGGLGGSVPLGGAAVPSGI
jgi:hypothetical protein